jgi:hypothetical protein
MAKLLDLPDELLIAILELAFEDLGPLWDVGFLWGARPFIGFLVLCRRIGALLPAIVLRHAQIVVSLLELEESKAFLDKLGHANRQHVERLHVHLEYRPGDAEDLAREVLALPAAGVEMEVTFLLEADLFAEVDVGRFKKVLDNLRIPVKRLAVKTQEDADGEIGPDYAISVQKLLRALPDLRVLLLDVYAQCPQEEDLGVQCEIEVIRTDALSMADNSQFLRSFPHLRKANFGFNTFEPADISVLPLSLVKLSYGLGNVSAEVEECNLKALGRLSNLRFLYMDNIFVMADMGADRMQACLAALPPSLTALTLRNTLLPTYPEVLAGLVKSGWLPQLKSLVCVPVPIQRLEPVEWGGLEGYCEARGVTFEFSLGTVNW